MSSIVVSGDTSGSVSLSAPAVAGTVTVTLPSTSGVMAVGGGTITTLTTTSDITVQGVTVGRGAGAVATNTAVGASALATNSTGVACTAVGYQALQLSTVDGNTAVGRIALQATSTGAQNTAVGAGAAPLNTTGTGLVALGANALGANTTGSSNVGVGRDSLASNTTASNNTAVGYQAGYSNVTGPDCTFIGRQAGYSSTGTRNTFIGAGTGYSTTGTYNTFVGTISAAGGACGEAVTTGSKNTIIGGYSGNQGGLDIRTASNWVVISDGDGNPRYGHDGAATGRLYPQGQTNLNYYGFDNAQFYPLPDNLYKLGNASYRWTTVYATTGTINTSDANTKQDIAALDDAEKRVAICIKSLIKKYRFKDAVAIKGDAARIHIGAVAQEVQAAFVTEGLDPARYALFCSDTWYEVDGKAAEPANPYTAETEGAVEVTRLGLRYDELLAFVISAL